MSEIEKFDLELFQGTCRRKNCSVGVYSPLKAPAYNLDSDAALPAPFGYNLGLFAYSEGAGISFIGTLLKSVSPLTVLGTIIPVIINSFYRVAIRGALAHIGVKVFKKLPRLANTNPPQAILFVTRVVRKLASALNRRPNIILWPFGESMSGFSLSGGFSSEATTRPSFVKVGRTHIHHSPAITPTSPPSPITVFPICTANQTPVSLACSVYEIGGMHTGIIAKLSKTRKVNYV